MTRKSVSDSGAGVYVRSIIVGADASQTPNMSFLVIYGVSSRNFVGADFDHFLLSNHDRDAPQHRPLVSW